MYTLLGHVSLDHMHLSICIPCTVRTLSCLAEVYISQPGAVKLLSYWDYYIHKVRLRDNTHGWVLIICWYEHGVPWNEHNPHILEFISGNIKNTFAYSIISQHWVRSLSCFIVIQISGAAAVTMPSCLCPYVCYISQELCTWLTGCLALL